MLKKIKELRDLKYDLKVKDTDFKKGKRKEEEEDEPEEKIKFKLTKQSKKILNTIVKDEDDNKEYSKNIMEKNNEKKSSEKKRSILSMMDYADEKNEPIEKITRGLFTIKLKVNKY